MIEVNRIVSSVENDNAAKVGYELRFLSRNRHVRSVVFPDIQVVGSGGGRLFHGDRLELTEIVTHA